MDNLKTDAVVVPGVRYAFGQYHATATVDGRVRSRYFATLKGAIAWRDRQHDKQRRLIAAAKGAA